MIVYLCTGARRISIMSLAELLSMWAVRESLASTAQGAKTNRPNAPNVHPLRLERMP